MLPCLIEDALKEIYNTKMDQATEEEIRVSREYVFKRGLVTFLLIGADRGQYGIMKNQIQQIMAMGTNNYPKSVHETTNILNLFVKMNKSGTGKKPFQRNENNIEVVSAQKRNK